jgi:phosphate transport system protein
MDTDGLGHHISQPFNEELERVRNHVLAMGGIVEEQISQAVAALVNADGSLGENVAHKDFQVDRMEVVIDEECTRILARRQPAAGDLRLVLAVIRAITDLERMGDEAEKIGRMAAGLAEMERPPAGYPEIETLGSHVRAMLRDALDAFARMDAEAALRVAHEDLKVDREYEAIIRQCITFMMEDPRTIRRVLNIIWCARALERIGDHAKNVAEHVIYLVRGHDVRHRTLEEMEQVVGAASGNRGSSEQGA